MDVVITSSNKIIPWGYNVSKAWNTKKNKIYGLESKRRELHFLEVKCTKYKKATRSMGLRQKVRMEAHIYLNSAQVMEKKNPNMYECNAII